MKGICENEQQCSFCFPWISQGWKTAMKLRIAAASPRSLRSCWMSCSERSSSRLTLVSSSWAWICCRLCSAFSLPATACWTSIQLCSSSCLCCFCLLSSEVDIQSELRQIYCQNVDNSQMIHYNKLSWVVRLLTLFFQISQSFLYELGGSFELLCELVSLFTHQAKLCLEVCDAAGQHRQDGRANKGTESQGERLKSNGSV